MLTADQIEFAFLKAAGERGLVIRKLVADGRLHRCDAEGRGGRGDGAYFLHLDGIPNGGFMDWRDGRGWDQWKADFPALMSPTERAALKAASAAKSRERKAERAAAAEEAARRAADFWSRAREADRAHPYLVRKNILPHGVRQLGERLLVPVKDAGKELRGLQWISPPDADGRSRKVLGLGTAKTGCAYRIGKLGRVAAIAEGFATAASIHEATGLCAFVAFDADNLLPVARALRAKCASVSLVFAADDDWTTAGNPGVTKARAAAQAVGSAVAIPAFGTDRGERDTDFNDMAARYGLAAVRRQIEEGLRMS